MFEVTGENAELQFDVKEGVEGASFTVSGKISDEESASVGDPSFLLVQVLHLEWMPA